MSADKQKHTPGPWVAEPEYEGDPPVFIHASGTPICDEVYGRTDEEADANSRLIAAAPDLLAMLKVAADIIGHPDDDMSKLIRATIAKAEGVTESASTHDVTGLTK